jgi:hypothetical protein
MYGNVAAHAWSPPNIHHSEEAAKAMADAKCCVRILVHLRL